MSLINYIEPVDVGSFFAGLGVLVISCVIAYIIYRVYIKFAQFIDVIINREAKYEILEESFLDKIGKAKGIDLDKELVKRKMFEGNKRKTFRKRIEEQVYEEMFGEEKTE